MPHDQNRVTFLVMEKDRIEYIHLGLGDDCLGQFPHAAYGLVLGCLKDYYIDGIVFIPLSESASGAIEQADLTLSCEVP